MTLSQRQRQNQHSMAIVALVRLRSWIIRQKTRSRKQSKTMSHMLLSKSNKILLTIPFASLHLFLVSTISGCMIHRFTFVCRLVCCVILICTCNLRVKSCREIAFVSMRFRLGSFRLAGQLLFILRGLVSYMFCSWKKLSYFSVGLSSWRVRIALTLNSTPENRLLISG